MLLQCTRKIWPNKMQSYLEFKTFAGRRVHLGACGSIAVYKALELTRLLQKTGVSLGATLTDAAAKFVTPLSFEALGAYPVHSSMFNVPGEPFGHLEPGQNGHVMAIVPASANILAKMAHGMADDMLSTQILAFDGPVVVAPAMNPRMWNAPATRENWAKLKERGLDCIEPGSGSMACGDEGTGRLAEVPEIYCRILRALAPNDLTGRKVLVTLGPTREPYDAVRFWSNPSSGTMGAAIAVAAWMRGAEVSVVRGPSNVLLPEPIRTVDVKTAQEMYDACHDIWPMCDTACLSAAVADFRPVRIGDHKLKKSTVQGDLQVRFESNEDILKSLGACKKNGQFLIGFAAETEDLPENMQRKLESKNLNLIVGNRINKPDSGFGVPTNEVSVLNAEGRFESWPSLPKTEVAWRIWDFVSGR